MNTGADAIIRILIASPDPNLRMQLRRFMAETTDITIVGSTRFGDHLREAALQATPTVMLIDARTEEAGAHSALQLAASLGIKALVLRGATRFDAAGVPVIAILACSAEPSLESTKGSFAQGLIAALRAAAPRVARPLSTAAPLGPRASGRPEIIAFGSSTGGPQALAEVFRHLTQGIQQPMVLTQHMPPRFTTMLAEQISRSGLPATEASDGLILEPGHLYIAPGGRHLLLARKAERLVCQLDDGPPENFCRPAVDPMLRSVVRACGGRTLAVILTGMGSDGLAGCREVVKAGGTVLAQDEASSVVWGMPGAVAQAGLCHSILPLGGIAKAILTLATGHSL